MGSLSNAEQAYAPRFERMMDELWQALVAHWGNAFIARFGEDWVAEKTWQSEMRGLTKNQILAGLEVCKYDERFAEWPPAARVFRMVAILQPLREGGLSADEVYKNICNPYARNRPAEAVWILNHCYLWEDLRKGGMEAEAKFRSLWRDMVAFIAAGGKLPEPVKPVPQLPKKRNPVNWSAIRKALEASA